MQTIARMSHRADAAFLREGACEAQARLSLRVPFGSVFFDA